MCPYGMFNTMSIYLHTFQEAQAKAMDAVANAIRLKPADNSNIT